MGRLLNFIIIDEFKTRRLKSIYFLTHWHSDHYDGICNTWPYGPIYCSPITRRLLLSKYPKMKDIVFSLNYDQQNIISHQIINFYGAEQTIQLKVRIYDSNHMAGSIMILFEYKEKWYLHTGDMRFNASVGERMKDLFEKCQNENNVEQQAFKCKYPIQQLFLDNTFCDPIFMFPPRSYALKLITRIISQYKPSRVFLCTDSVGKQQAFIYMSKKYNCKIKVSKDRLRYIKCMMGVEWKKYFTVDNDEVGVWIEVIRKGEKEERVGLTRNSVAITLTGWANLNDYHPIGYNSFVVPYSLHSNYKEIELLVKSIRPKQIIPIVNHNQERQSEHFREKIGSFEAYMVSLSFIKQRGLQYLKKQYQTKHQNEKSQQQTELNQNFKEIEI